MRSSTPRAAPSPDMRSLRASIACLAAVVAVTCTAPAPVGAEPVHFLEFTVGDAGPLGSVSFIGDSVGIGAGLYAPTLPDQLLSRGWGPVRFHAVDGKRTGLPPGWPDHFNAVPMIDHWQAAGWDSDTWIINLGANDSGFCRTDVNCARAAILLVVDAIGPGHRIWWPKITRFYTHHPQADAWNVALEQIDAERADFWTWDWPSEMAARPEVYGSWDNTHLYPDGYRARSAAMAQAFTDAVATATRIGGDVALPGAAGSPTAVIPVAPRRVVDTRDATGGRLPPGGRLAIDLSTHVPASTTAVAVNIAAVDPAAPGFLTAFACEAPQPATSNVNFTNRTRAAGLITGLSAAKQLCVTASAETDVIVDLQAVFVPPGTGGALRMTALDTPARLLDTRLSGRARSLRVPVPSGTAGVAVNITATGAAEPGFVAAHPCGSDPPLVSNVNVAPGDTNASAGFVRAGAGAICLTTNVDTDVIVDLTGTLAAGAGLLFVPAQPKRMLDTRDATGGWSPIHGAHQTLDVAVAPAQAHAVTGTLTLVRPGSPSFLTAAPCETTTPTSTSSVNAGTGGVVANLVIVRVTTGRVCLTAHSAGHTLFDVTGWWLPG
jgi:hypothetical protein